MKAGDILDRIIRANYIFLFWLTVFALVGSVLLFSIMDLESDIPPIYRILFSE
jgi:hypothetical protein